MYRLSVNRNPGVGPCSVCRQSSTSNLRRLTYKQQRETKKGTAHTLQTLQLVGWHGYQPYPLCYHQHQRIQIISVPEKCSIGDASLLSLYQLK